MNKKNIVFLVVFILIGCNEPSSCRQFLDSHISITQLKTRSECFSGKNVKTGGFVGTEQLGVYIFENPTDREFNRNENAIFLSNGIISSGDRSILESADYVDLTILYRGSGSVGEILEITMLN